MLATATNAFVMAFVAIFTVANPIGCALVYARITAGASRGVRAELSRRIAVNAILVLIVAMWAGGLLMAVFGISLSALRIAGGLVIAVQAWRSLNEDSGRSAARPATAAASAADAFFPLTIPFTTGPGTIAAAISLGTDRPADLADLLPFVLGATTAFVAFGGSVALLYSTADRVVGVLGPSRASVLMRLSAFALMCVGIEILLQGLRGALTGR
jgi:multiple antibiotic resistance protein